MTDQLSKLSLQELIDLNAAVQNEMTKRLLQLEEENKRLTRDSMMIRESRDVSVSNDVQGKQNKNSGWITTAKLKATANRFLFKNVETKPVISKRNIHRDFIWDVQWCHLSDSHNIFITASADRTAKIWRIDRNDPRQIIKLWNYTGHTGSVNSARYHPTQHIICTASGDHTCHIWKPEDSSPCDEEYGSTSRRSPSDDCAISKPLAKLISHQGYVTVCDWNTDGSCVISGSQDASIKVWEMNDWSKPLYTLTGHDGTVTSIATHPSSVNVFGSASHDKTIRLWDTRTSSFMLNVLHGHERAVSFLLFDQRNPRILISGSDDCSVKLWDLKTLQCLKTIHTSYVVNHFCASPDSSMLCLPSKNASAEIYSSQGVPLTLLSGNGNGHNRMIYTCDWSDAGILTAGLDRNICLWDVSPIDSYMCLFQKQCMEVECSMDGSSIWHTHSLDGTK